MTFFFFFLSSVVLRVSCSDMLASCPGCSSFDNFLVCLCRHFPGTSFFDFKLLCMLLSFYLQKCLILGMYMLTP